MKWCFVICGHIGISVCAVAQQHASNASGVYQTKEDFLGNNVYHLAKNDADNFVKIGSNQSIFLYRGSEKKKFKFREVYGYYNNGAQYRKFGAIKFFTKYGYAQIIDSRGLILYSATYAAHKVGRTHYFYSLTKDSPVKYFSIANLKKDFPDNTEFVNAIKKLSYKEYSWQKDGQYLINDLYLKSINTK